jgi:hypothetical protein
VNPSPKKTPKPTRSSKPRPQQALIAFIHRVDQSLCELDEALKQLEQEPLGAEEISIIANEINTMAKGREALAAGLRTDIYNKYKTIVMKHRGTAVVNVINHTCQGCYVQLPTGLITKIQAQDQISFCPSCNRILVTEENAGSD